MSLVEEEHEYNTLLWLDEIPSKHRPKKIFNIEAAHLVLNMAIPFRCDKSSGIPCSYWLPSLPHPCPQDTLFYQIFVWSYPDLRSRYPCTITYSAADLELIREVANLAQARRNSRPPRLEIRLSNSPSARFISRVLDSCPTILNPSSSRTTTSSRYQK